MALSFNQVKGEASKEKTPSYKMRDGENRIRLFGGVLARYIYWVPNREGQKTPVECLSFNRETEKFNNGEKDWVKEYFPDLTPEWAYASLCIDLKDPGAVRIFNHKKKLFATIVNMVEELGDPTDPTTGWDIVFNKAKSGPKIYNVEYTVMQLKCKPRALTETELGMFSKHPTIDEVLRRAPPEDIKKYLDELRAGAPSTKEGIDDEIPAEFS
ncbi:hypothetical protein EBZ38_01710 [bacterium]|nr:hypothetical protein [bacterium]